MKKTAYVFTGDFGHPKDTIIPIISKIFDDKQWHVCVMDSIEDICFMSCAPDLLVSFQVGNSGITDHKPSWYESSPFTYQWIKWIREDGCGLLIVHGGLCFIPQDHPVITRGTIGYFNGHPQACSVHVVPVSNLHHPVTEGIGSFDLELDEHFQIKGLEENDPNIQVLAYSSSSEGGTQPAVWVHTVEKGRICVITPGHASTNYRPLEHSCMLKLLRQSVNWCSQTDLPQKEVI